MEDFNALAALLGSGIDDVRGCLILSRDGLVLGAHPETGEAAAKPAWLRFAALGDFERGFVQYGAEVWCYVRRGPYAAFAVTGPHVRPGLVIDQMEQALLEAEAARGRREGLKPHEAPASAGMASSRPRTPLHPDPRPVEEPIVIRAEQPRTATRGPATPATAEAAAAAQAGQAAPDRSAEAAASEPEEGEEVDRFSLAREFSRLLQEDDRGADG